MDDAMSSKKENRAGSSFALFDPSGQPDLLARLQRLPPAKRTCLWRGSLGEALADVAPHLAVLQPRSTFGRWFLGAGKGHGIICTSEAGLDELAAHFRSLLLVAAYPLG